MRTTKDELKEAGIKRFYAVEIAKNRYSVYFVSTSEPGRLEVLWPDHGQFGQAKDLPSGMVYNGNGKLPAYHFNMRGHMNHGYEIAAAIALWLGYTERNAVTVELLTGCQSTSNF